MFELIIGSFLVWIAFFILAVIVFGDADSVSGSFLLMFAANSLMALVRWFLVDHYSFWHGFKELVWALCPLLNIAYVWEWWFNIAMFLGLLVTSIAD